MDAPRLDRIGYWSELKLEIIRKYADAYSVLVAKWNLYHVYIDAFAGAGEHISKTTGQMVPGSPLNALAVEPPFREYHLIDLDPAKTTNLRALTEGRPNVHVYQGDCNEVLINEVFPRARYEDYKRALCILDPYGLHLRWQVVQKAGQMLSVEIFLNFPIMDMNMNVLKRDREKVNAAQEARMNAFWGDSSWKDAAYSGQAHSGQQFLFGEEKTRNEDLVEAFRERLATVGGFRYVPEPMPMRNSTGAVVYYLFFATHNKTGETIATDIFRKYRDRQGA